VSRGSIAVDIASVETQDRPQPWFAVAQALAKGGRDEDAVEAMTEVGVDVVVGWQSARSVAKWSDRTEARWTATARAAAKQARRAWLPDFVAAVTTQGLAERVSAATLAVVLHEAADRPLAALDLPADGEVLVVVGPEGGVAPEELDLLTAAGAQVCRLGRHVLRTSTAGVAAISVLSAASRWR
jgi:16S rRNA (uracil1498-N3)-methyltransferase